jgi:hypothetical protein
MGQSVQRHGSRDSNASRDIVQKHIAYAAAVQLGIGSICAA